jgi:exosome complex RNA-binding protein Rrp4
MSNIEITDRPCIVVATNGHVWVAKSVKQDSAWLHCTDARIINTWGTTKGLNQLVDGPTKETVLDAIAPSSRATAQAGPSPSEAEPTGRHVVPP